jgi:hypothetical protein
MMPDRPTAPRLAPISGDRTLLAWRTGAMGEGVSMVDLPDRPSNTSRAKTSPVAGNGLGFVHDGNSSIVHPFVAWGEDTKVVVKRGDATDPELTTLAWNQVGDPFGAAGATTPALCPTIAFHGGVDPVVAWSQGAPVTAVQMRRWNGTVWDFVTPIDSAAGNNTAGCPLIAGNPSTPLAAAWVGTAADQTRRVYVQRWVSMSRWEAWGAPLGSGQADATVTLGGLVLNMTGLPTVAWHELRGAESTIHVSRWDGTGWVELGGVMPLSLPAANTPPALALDAAGVPLLAWLDNSTGKPSVAVWKRVGTSWERIGGSVLPGSGNGAPAELSLAYAGGVPYVAFIDVTPTARSIYAHRMK